MLLIEGHGWSFSSWMAVLQIFIPVHSVYLFNFAPAYTTFSQLVPNIRDGTTVGLLMNFCLQRYHLLLSNDSLPTGLALLQTVIPKTLFDLLLLG
ncbi:uncharacterized protein EV420DRAFT_1545078 [Desarmillaria tabescens]|uniref:Uncharacterized protein n=1 Tax=Armillaria tabescens TaxID=1929756 RepID=A0AA39N5T3_ARMTA|nr:uncharacterized protein EV420DRAFT_1545078 [Desarmillaria tabescens]KAK0458345.1 hypothetical protein EV420DRAFT_1545078 [Desarmillaria tabescens]